MPDWKFRIDREQREVAAAHEGFIELIERASAVASKGALRGNAAARANVFRSLDKGLRAAIHPLRSRYDELPSRSGRTTSLEACHVALMPDHVFKGKSHLARLTAVRIAFLPDEIEIERLPLNACVRPHAAERVLERAELFPESAMRHVAGQMLEWLLVPFVADDTLEKLDLTRMSVPAEGDGLVLGYMDRTSALPVGEVYRIRAEIKNRFEIPASPYSPGVYVANTFLGPREIKAEHRELIECLLQWRDHCGVAYWHRLEDGLWPHRAVRPPVRGSSKLPEGAIDALRELFFEERAIHAVQSCPPPRVFERDEDGLQTFGEVENEFYRGGDAMPSHRFL